MTTEPYGGAFDDSVDEFLSGTYDPLDRGTTSEIIGGYVVNWRTLDDREEIAEAWTALREWVEWFTVRYAIPSSVIPDCWWRHGALVEELSALRTAHLAAFDPSDTGYGPISWHERCSLAVSRFGAAYKNGCLQGHQDPHSRSWANATPEREWAAWCASTHAHPEEGTRT